jgi:hypothetical protein
VSGFGRHVFRYKKISILWSIEGLVFERCYGVGSLVDPNEFISDPDPTLPVGQVKNYK